VATVHLKNVASGLNKYLLSAPSHKQHHNIKDTDKSLSSEKLPLIKLSSSQQGLVAAVAQVFQGFMSMNKRPGFPPRAPSRCCFNNNLRNEVASLRPGDNRNFPQQHQQPQRRLPSTRMCKNCASLNPTDPNIANKLAAHKKACAKAHKKLIRDRISTSASGSQQLPSTTP
jgi:hypothetical protein